MKKLLILAVVAALSFWGCSENSSITEPNDVQSNQSFLKVNSDIQVSELSAEAKSVLEIKNVNTLSKSWLPSSTEKEINEDGGNVRFLLADDGTLALGNLGIASDEFTENTLVSVAIVSEEAALDLTPNWEFNKAAELTVGFIGVDVSVDDNVKFVYMKDGAEVLVDNSGIIVGNGWVVVVKAQLGHFSRFGFTK